MGRPKGRMMGNVAILMICPRCYKSFPAETKICPKCNLRLLEARHRHLKRLTKRTKRRR